MKITEQQLKKIDRLINEMTLDDLVGQLICPSMGKQSDEEIEEMAKKIRLGGIFVSRSSKEDIARMTDIINKHTKVPVIVAADIEHGAGCAFYDEHVLPEPMAWGACDDEELIFEAGKVTGEICRRKGIHWNFAPIVDINYNKDNPVTNVRAISDSPKQVAKIAGAYVKGMQENGMMIAGCKHFPGDGMDDRNQHFCTTINTLSKEEWMETYGYVYKEMFKAGSESVMVGHIAAPAFEDEIDPILGPKPGTLSYNLMTKLLRQELGFEGCIVSDAMSMVGACSMFPPEQLPIEFMNAGGDMILFAQERDFNYVKEAVQNGIIKEERLKDAVRHILVMKAKARLLDENQKEIIDSIELSGDITEISKKIADKSIKIVRNSQNLIPLKVSKGAKFLLIDLQAGPQDRLTGPYIQNLDTITEELKNRGFEVDTMSGYNMSHYELDAIKDNYDCILVNSKISCRDYLGGTLRINRDNLMAFWRGVVLDHPCMIFTSFGDPYKLHDFPFLKTYVNTFSQQKDTQKAFVEVLLGEREPVAKNPVGLKGMFEREVD